MPLKGWHHSEESKRKMSESRKGHIPWNTGKTYSVEQKRNLAGHIPWNKGKQLSLEYRQKLSQAHRGNTPSQEARTNMSLAQKGKTLSLEQRRKISQSHIGIRPSNETREKLSNSHKGIEQSVETRRKHSLAILKAYQEGRIIYHKPNKSELKLDRILRDYFPGEWKFVGDGQVYLGGCIPDFINCNGRKLIIELFGDVWHGRKWPVPYRQTENGRRHIFARYGYGLLIVWDSELGNLPAEEIAAKVRDFMEVF